MTERDRGTVLSGGGRAVKPTAAASPAQAARLYEDHADAAYQLVLLFGADPESAEDAVSAAFVEVLQHWSTIIDREAALYRAAVRLHFEDLGQQRVLAAALEPGGVEPAIAEECGFAEIEGKAHVAWLLDELLTRAERDAVAGLLTGESFVDLARVLGKTPAATRRAVKAGRDRLRPYLETLLRQPDLDVRTLRRNPPNTDRAKGR